jgi:rsbT co-antagonist protein RsbR
VRNQVDAGSLRTGQIKEDELTGQSQRFLREFVKALKDGQVDDTAGPAWSAARDLLGEISRSRALQSFTPTETATFVFSLKEPLFALLRDEIKAAQQLANLTWTVTKLVDKLGLHTVVELSTPVVELWDKILALPLIGTLDSERAQTVMANLLDHIVKLRAQVAIIDITGVSTVDTQVAQHLIKTVRSMRRAAKE